MIALLSDAWFEARFIKDSTAQGHRRQGALEGADGIFLWCPCAYPDDQRAHGLIISFANPQGAPPAPNDAGSCDRDGVPKRWTMTGTGLKDLTLSPSVDVGNPSCWHGFIVNGEVR